MSLEVDKYGYTYVESPPHREEIRKQRLISHIKYAPDKLSGEITFTLKTVAPVHVGSGIFELAEDAGTTGIERVVKGIVKENGLPVIPGSSLKGAFRSITEAISYSCLLDGKCQAKKEEDEICIACSIFGAMGFMGRWSFSKATIADENNYISMKAKTPIPMSVEMWKPNINRHKRKFYPYIEYLSDEFWKSANKLEFHNTANYDNVDDFIKDKVVEPYDFIPKDIEMCFSAKFENMDDKEIGLVLLGMGVGENNEPIFQPHIGGSKSFCFGAIEVRVEKVIIYYQRDAKTFKSFDDEKHIIGDVNAWVKEKTEFVQKESPDKSKNILFKDGLNKVKEILHFPTKLPVTVI